MKKISKKSLVKYRLSLANETIDEVDDLIKLGYYRTAVNRIYYACYYSATALLIKSKISAKSHSGVTQMLGLHFVKTGKISKEMGNIYSDLFDKRHTGDYDDFVDFEKDTVEELHESAKQFIKTISTLL